MWEAKRRALGRGEGVSVLRHGEPFAFGEGLEALRDDEGFRAFLLDELRRAPFAAFFWETPPVTRANAGRPFEYVTISALDLEAALADPGPFAAEFAAGPGPETVTAFANLSGDATLIAPKPLRPAGAYAHLAAFLRGAPQVQQHDLMALTAAKAREALSERPLWISTAGLGVSWLPSAWTATPNTTPTRRTGRGREPDSLDRVGGENDVWRRPVCYGRG